MGCIQSHPSHPPMKKKKVSRGSSTPTHEETEAARLLASKVEGNGCNRTTAEPRRETDVLRRAGAFDRAHEEALKSPSLRKLRVTQGEQTQKLLNGFAMKEADANCTPELRSVQMTDLKESKLYSMVRGFEEKDERARSEPKLEKTFSQRERERSQMSTGTLSTGALSAAMAARPVSAP